MHPIVASILVSLSIVILSVSAEEVFDGFKRQFISIDSRPPTAAYDPLRTLAVGSYPSNNTGNDMPPSSIEGNHLSKRVCLCSSGWVCCSNGACCRANEVCAPDNWCCNNSNPYPCGNRKCCVYDVCIMGECGCPNPKETRCGGYCCPNGCSADGNTCACPATTPVECSDNQTCCPSGTTCAGGGKCTGASGVKGSGSGGLNPSGSLPIAALSVSMAMAAVI